MDIEQYKKNVESRLKTASIKKHIKSEIQEYEDQQIGIYETSTTKYKPLIESNIEVKKAIDKKQDQLIDQIQQNQLALTNTLTNMNKEPELQELEGEVEKEPIAIEVNFDDKLDENDKVFLHNFKLAKPSVLFKDGVKHKQKNNSNFNEYLVQLKNLRDDLANENKKTVKKHPENIVSRKKYYLTIEKIISALKTIEIKQTGSGIRKYKQTKRNAYKINKSKYGGLLINMPKLLNNMIIEAHRGGKIIYQDKADKSLINLIRKNSIVEKIIPRMLLEYSTI